MRSDWVTDEGMKPNERCALKNKDILIVYGSYCMWIPFTRFPPDLLTHVMWSATSHVLKERALAKSSGRNLVSGP